jgi:hypothetical protein
MHMLDSACLVFLVPLTHEHVPVQIGVGLVTGDIGGAFILVGLLGCFMFGASE